MRYVVLMLVAATLLLQSGCSNGSGSTFADAIEAANREMSDVPYLWVLRDAEDPDQWNVHLVFASIDKDDPASMHNTDVERVLKVATKFDPFPEPPAGYGPEDGYVQEFPDRMLFRWDGETFVPVQ